MDIYIAKEEEICFSKRAWIPTTFQCTCFMVVKEYHWLPEKSREVYEGSQGFK